MSPTSRSTLRAASGAKVNRNVGAVGRMRTVLKTVLLLIGVAGTASAQLKAEVRPDADPPGNADWKCDWLTLTITRGTNVIYRHEFESAYGEATAEIFIAPWGQYAILRSGIGRGTSVRTEYLTVYEMTDYLVEVLRTPVSGYAGPGALWEYQYTIHAESNALVLSMVRKVDHYSPESKIMALPKDRRRVLRVERSPKKAPEDTARKLADPQR